MIFTSIHRPIIVKSTCCIKGLMKNRVDMDPKGSKTGLDAFPANIARELILKELDVPVVFKEMIDGWQCRRWTIKEWASQFGKKQMQFRIGQVQQPQNSEPLWETDCSYIQSTIEEFDQWQEGKLAPTSKANESTIESATKLSDIKCDAYWAYADYKHMAELFEFGNDIHNTLDWGTFGFKDRKGQDSTIWIGSPNSHTPCHYDTYGCNLVAQLVGKKRWILFPPGATDCLYPRRIPYEESSVFSAVNINVPNITKFPKFASTSPYIVTLEEGDVLFVPHKWWHFVKCLTTSVTINSWIELEVDDERRLEEAVTRTVLSTYMAVHSNDRLQWLNPTEDYIPPDMNISYIKEALEICVQNKGKEKPQVEEHVKDVELEKGNSHATKSNKPTNQIAKRVGSAASNISTKKLRKESSLNLEQVLSRFPNQIKLLKRMPYVDFNKEIILGDFVPNQIPKVDSPRNLSSANESNQFKMDFLNALVDPDVVSLICEKLKTTYM